MGNWGFRRELRRKGAHLLAVFFILIFVIISETFGEKLALFALVFLLIIFLELEFVRIELRRKIPILWRLWRTKEKKREDRCSS